MKTNIKKKNKFKKIIPFVLVFSSLGIILFTTTNSGIEAKGYRNNSEEKEVLETVQTIEPTQNLSTDGLSLVGYGNSGALEDEVLSLEDMLTYAIQDEYTAKGEYETIIGTYGNISPYSKIVDSEATHISALTTLFETYNIPLTQDDSSEHVVIPESLLDSAKTGVQAEIDNIAMYEKFLTYNLPDDVREVFESLKDASYNHLAAFEKQVDRLSR